MTADNSSTYCRATEESDKYWKIQPKQDRGKFKSRDQITGEERQAKKKREQKRETRKRRNQSRREQNSGEEEKERKEKETEGKKD